MKQMKVFFFRLISADENNGSFLRAEGHPLGGVYVVGPFC